MILLFLGFEFVFLLSVFMLLLDGFDFVGEFPGDLDEEGHGVLHESCSPGVFHDDIWSEEVIAGVEADGEELLLLVLDEEFQEVLDEFGLLRFLGGFDSISVDLVLLAEVDGEVVFLDASVEECCDSPELHEVMVLRLLGELELVETFIVGH